MAGTECDSSDLLVVPGDIGVNLSSCDFSRVRADPFLLSGDAIVNEIMLTSVPVSKSLIKDDLILICWCLGSSNS